MEIISLIIIVSWQILFCDAEASGGSCIPLQVIDWHECGLAPSVTLDCTDGSAHVDWVASRPGCQFDCKGYWNCTNITNYYEETSSTHLCNNQWAFDIPWEHYSCNVTVQYAYFSLTTSTIEWSPTTIKSCSRNSVQLQYDNNCVFGRLHEVNCILYAYTSEPVNSNDVSINWSGPNGVVVANESSRITVIPTTSNGYNHTSTLQFSCIIEDDEDTSYNCTTSLSEGDKTLSYYKSFTISDVTGKNHAKVKEARFGNTLILLCNCVIAGAYSWTKDNKPITIQTSGIAIHTNNLTIISMTHQLVGIYQCLSDDSVLSVFDVKLVGAQYSICTSNPYACPKTLAYSSDSHFTLNATIVFIGSCCDEKLSDPKWTVITNPSDSGQQVGNNTVYNPPGIHICTETGFDFTANIARVRIDGANTTFKIMHSIYTDVDGEHLQQRSLIFTFYYAKVKKLRSGDTSIISCQSSVMSGRYSWTKDNEPITAVTAQTSGIAKDTIHTNDLEIISMTRQLVGIYQCILDDNVQNTFDVKIVDLAQYSICTSDSNACSQNFTYNTGDHFILNATIEFINSGMDCCHEGVTNPVWIVNATPGDPGVQVGNYRAFNPPGIYICTETSRDFTTNIARVTIINAKTTFQIMHSIETDVDGKHHQQKSMIFNFYYAENCPQPQFMKVQSTNITAVEGYNTSLKCFFDGFYSQLSSPVQMWVLFPHNTTSMMLGNHPPPECRCSIEFKNKPVCSVDTDPNDCCKFEMIMQSTPDVNMTGTTFSCTKNFSSEEAVWMFVVPSPKVIEPPHNLSTINGSNANFTCKFEASTDNEIAQLHWEFNGSDLAGCREFRERINCTITQYNDTNVITSTLEIISVQADNAGQYTCYCSYNTSTLNVDGVQTIQSEHKSATLSIQSWPDSSESPDGKFYVIIGTSFGVFIVIIAFIIITLIYGKKKYMRQDDTVHQPEEQVTDKILDKYIVDELFPLWEKLGKALQLPGSFLDDTYNDFPTNSAERLRAVFREWKTTAEHPTVVILDKRLEQIGYQNLILQ